MKNIKIVVLVLSAVLLTSCKSTPKPAPVAVDTRPSEANLTLVDADRRAQIVSDVNYTLQVEMDETSDSFKASEQIEFVRKDSPHDLFLDFKNGAKIENFALNGKPLTPAYAQHRIILPQALLAVGPNKVEVTYQQKYSTNGRGLHRFTDPEDKRVYFYSQFEAFDAHQMFPCFDQPNIKATMQMGVTAPKDWEVITTTRETTTKVVGENRVWNFAKTPKISTYLFSLAAGPYAKWESNAGPVHLRLFSRQALKKFVVTKDWWAPTKAGLKFYGDYFAYPYPFKKYDQIIVPEFNAGAMENVAAVTFTERFIHRSASTYKEREGLASVILHEMAHMWFGDLVTMNWWNGLWLNESFATYMSSLSQANATEFKDSWISFYARSKTGAYIEDQLVTTHPIEATIPDTDSAFSNFDSITYGKGASVLKQLSFYLSENVFREGVRGYFKEHAYSNTRLEDFMGALEKASGKDLKQWSKTWLEMAGVDTVEAEFKCENGVVSGFALKLQGPGGEPSLREHRSMVALYQEKAGKIVPLKEQNVLYKGPRTEVPELNGAACPKMVFPNEGDQDYLKVRLDALTLAATKENLNKVSSNFTRILFWPNLFSMVRDVELKPQDFLKIVQQNFPGEMDLTINEAILMTVPRVINYLPQDTENKKEARASLVNDIENMFWKKIETAPTVDLKKMALSGFTENVESRIGRDRLLGILDGTMKFPGLIVDADRRWDIIVRLAALGDTRVDPLLAHQREIDKSDRGVNSAFAAEATKPSLEVKNTWISKVVDNNDMSYAQKRRVLGSLLPRRQDDLRAALGDKYYATLPGLVKSREMNFLTLYTSTLMPATCTTASASKLSSFMTEQAGTLPTPVIKILRIGQQEDSRCVAIRASAD